MFEDKSAFRDTYGGVGRQWRWRATSCAPADRSSKTAILFMHPIGGGAYLPMTNALARAGHHVIYANSRYRVADYA